MPRGYILNDLYNTKRAIFRKLYSEEFRVLSSVIKSKGLPYSLIVKSINDGIYTNLDTMISKTYAGSNDIVAVGDNKSSNALDFMSPMELRMNTIAVKRASAELSKNNLSQDEMMSICYKIGADVARQFYMLGNGSGDFDMKAKSPILNIKPIIKKYDMALQARVLPESEAITLDTYEKELTEKFINLNIYRFHQIKNQMIEMGIDSAKDRAMVYLCLNSGYYDVRSKDNALEITKLLVNSNKNDIFSLDELSANYKKLDMFYNEINKLNKNTTLINLSKCAFKVGSTCRKEYMLSNRKLPEIFNGFYEVYVSNNRSPLLKKDK